MVPVIFDASIPVPLQLNDFSCSVGATFWCLQSLGSQLSQQQLEDIMVPALVSPEVGLLDATGATIDLKRQRFAGAGADDLLHVREAVDRAPIDRNNHVARPVLRHRIVTTFHAEAEGIDPDKVVGHLLEAVAAPAERAAARLTGDA